MLLKLENCDGQVKSNFADSTVNRPLFYSNSEPIDIHHFVVPLENLEIFTETKKFENSSNDGGVALRFLSGDAMPRFLQHLLQQVRKNNVSNKQKYNY